MAKRRTQAVVVIHGIGEQKPMDTLRGFVEAVLPKPEEGEKYFSKPDTMSEELELRKLQDRNQPRTHFYEYYWAYKVEGTTFWHVWSWLRSLLWRRPSRVPPHLRGLWWLTWLLALAALSFWGMYAAVAEAGAIQSRLFWLAILSSALLALVQGTVIGYVGDAARYLSPHPSNIALRQRIRADGIKLLRKLHESKRGQHSYYDRIVVVGHSLGTVIAYDILKHLWQQMHRDYAFPKEHEQPALATVEKEGEKLPHKSTDEKVRAFHEHKTRLWWEFRELGNPWLVTDLITLGSPLAHAGLLLAKDPEELEKRQRQRELPSCPPVAEIDEEGVKHYSFRVWEPYVDDNGGEHVLRALHHAGAFGVTRWTNLYFRTRWALFGDLISGPLREWFGSGILDRRVTHKSWIRTHTPLAHTSYWRVAGDEAVPAIQELIAAMDLSGESTYEDLCRGAP